MAGSSPFHRQDDTFPLPGNELHQENGTNNFHFGKQWGQVLKRERLRTRGPAPVLAALVAAYVLSPI